MNFVNIMNELILENKINALMVKDLMDDIIESAYPDFFATCDRMSSEIALSIDSMETEMLLNAIESIKGEVERIFYREKLVVYPFIQTSILNKQEINLSTLQKVDSEMNKVSKNIQNLIEKIRTFEMADKEKDSKSILIMLSNMVNNSWQVLSSKRLRLNSSISSDITKK